MKSFRSVRGSPLSPVALQCDEAVVGSAMTQNCISARQLEEILSPKLTFKSRGISLPGSVVRVSPVRRSGSH